MNRWMWIIALLALGGCAAGAGDDDDRNYGDPPPECETVGFELGDCAPDFNLPSIAGGDVSLAHFSGQRILVFGTSNW